MNQIEITDGGSRDLYGMIRQGRIDLAVLGSTQPIVDQYLETELLLDKRFMIVVPPTSSFQAGYCLFQRYSR